MFYIFAVFFDSTGKGDEKPVGFFILEFFYHIETPGNCALHGQAHIE
jgi:hypothetical protein